SPDPRVLHSFPTRRSSDLALGPCTGSLALCTRHCVLCLPALSAHVTHRGAYAAPLAISSCLLVSHSPCLRSLPAGACARSTHRRSEEHTSELQSRSDVVCR